MQKISKQKNQQLKNMLKDTKTNDDELIEFFMEYWMDNGEMPYGTQKARDGDPYNWTTDKLEQVGEKAAEQIIDELTENTIIEIFNKKRFL